MTETSDTLLGAQFFRGGQALDDKMLGWLALSAAVFTQKCRKMLTRRDPVSATFGNHELCKYSSRVPKPCTRTTPWRTVNGRGLWQRFSPNSMDVFKRCPTSGSLTQPANVMGRWKMKRPKSSKI